MNENEMLQDHECRLKKLEESDVRQQVQLANIEKSQSEIKLMINDSNKEQQNTLHEFTEKILTTFTNNLTNDNKTNNKIKFYNRKELWAVVGIIGGALIAYLKIH